MKRFLSGVATAALFANAAVAQDAFVLDDIVFSAGLEPVRESRTGVTTDVLTGEDLRYSGNLQLSSRLAAVPGLSVSQSGPAGTQTTLRIRGLDTSYIPVLLNGIEITDPSGIKTEFDFGALPGAPATRVEILRGSQGPIFGSEAIAGVVNVSTDVTPDAQGTEVTIGLEAGSHETYLGSFTVGTRSGHGSLSFSATRLVTEGFSAADENDGNPEADAHRSTTLTLLGEYDASETLTLGFSAFLIDSFSEIDQGFPVADNSDTQETQRYGARTYATFDAFGIEHEVALAGSRTERYFPGGFTENFTGERTSLSYLGSADLGAESSLAFGIDHTREAFLTDTDSGDVDTTAVFAEYLAALSPDFDLSVSLRYDDHSVFGGQTTGRVAGAWRPAEGTVVRGSLATGFRAPSLFELYSSFGNTNLAPEQSRSVEIGVDQSFGELTVEATLFYTEIDDLIGFAAGSYNQIPGTSTTQGIELGADYRVTDSLSVFGNYTYTEAEDQNGDRLRRVPRHDSVLGIAGEFGQNWTGSFTIQHVADRVDPDPLRDYTLANAEIGYGLSETTEVYLRVENLFDEEYQTVKDYGTSDRALYVGLRSRF